MSPDDIQAAAALLVRRKQLVELRANVTTLPEAYGVWLFVQVRDAPPLAEAVLDNSRESTAVLNALITITDQRLNDLGVPNEGR